MRLSATGSQRAVDAAPVAPEAAPVAPDAAHADAHAKANPDAHAEAHAHAKANPDAHDGPDGHAATPAGPRSQRCQRAPHGCGIQPGCRR